MRFNGYFTILKVFLLFLGLARIFSEVSITNQENERFQEKSGRSLFVLDYSTAFSTESYVNTTNGEVTSSGIFQEDFSPSIRRFKINQKQVPYAKSFQKLREVNLNAAHIRGKKIVNSALKNSISEGKTTLSKIFHKALRGSSFEEPAVDYDSTYASMVEYVQGLISSGTVHTVIQYADVKSDTTNSIAFISANFSSLVTSVLVNFESGGSNGQFVNTGSLLSETSEDSEYRDADGDGSDSTSTNQILSAWYAKEAALASPLPANLFRLTENVNEEGVASSFLQGTFNCFQVLLDLEEFSGRLLPLELERFLGQVLCRCQGTLLKHDLPESTYFAYWESLSALVSNAVATVVTSPGASSCNITLDDGEKIFGEQLPYRLKSSYYIAARDLDMVMSPPPMQGLLPAQALLKANLHISSQSTVLSSVINLLSKKQPTSSTQASELLSDAYVSGSVLLHSSEADHSILRRKPLKSHSSSSSTSSSSYSSTSKYSSASTGSYSSRYTSSYSSSYSSKSSSSTSTTAPTVSSTVNITTAAPLHLSRYLLSSDYSLDETDINKGYYTFSQWELTDTSEDEFDLIAKTVDEEYARNSTLTKDLSIVKKEKDPKFSDSARIRVRDMHFVEDEVYSKWMGVLTKDQSHVVETVASMNRYDIQLDRMRMNRQASNTAMKEIKAARTVFVFGKYISLLSLKVSDAMDKVSKQRRTNARPVGTVVSVLTDDATRHTHEFLTENIFHTSNLIPCQAKMTSSVVSSLLGSPDRGDISIVQVDTVLSLLYSSLSSHSKACDLELFEESLAALLSLSNTTYVEIPSRSQVSFLATLLPNSCQATLDTAYQNQATNFEAILLAALTRLSEGVSMRYQRLDGDHAGYNSDGDHGDLISAVYRVQLFEDTSHRPQVTHPSNRNSFFGVSLYTLLNLGLVNSFRSKMLRLLVDLPILQSVGSGSDATAISADAVAPWNLFLRTYRSLDAADSGFRPVYFSLWHHAETDTLDSSKEFARKFTARSTQERKKRRKAGRSTEKAFSRRLEKDYLLKARTLGSKVGVSFDGASSSAADRIRAKLLWGEISKELSSHPADTTGGRFSFIDHNSGFGHFSALLAQHFPNATVVSLEGDRAKVRHHVSLLDALGLENNAVCAKADVDSAISGYIYESPEFFRYQLLSKGLLERFATAKSTDDWGQSLGETLSSALTTFLVLPTASQVSWAMTTVFGDLFNMKPETSSEDLNEIGDDDSAVGSDIVLSNEHGPFRPLSKLFENLPTSVRDPQALVNEKLSGYQLRVNQYQLSHHPTPIWKDFQAEFLLGSIHTSSQGSTEFKFRTLGGTDLSLHGGEIPILRCDIVNMTRFVHHHYNYKKDGHKRTYTLRVEVNETMTQEAVKALDMDISYAHANQRPDHIVLDMGGHNSGSAHRQTRRLAEQAHFGDSHHDGNNHDVPSRPVHDGSEEYLSPLPPTLNLIHHLPSGAHVSDNKVVTVNLMRDSDSFPIPYTSLYGVTLISVLRMGLDKMQKDRLLSKFLRLPLYEDMAPWNIVLMGPTLDYIDYDTKQFVFDMDVPKAYMVMAILMNYKRTVEDLGKCGSKAATVYGLPYVSDCVGKMLEDHKPEKCPDMRFAVPCGDGVCHSDYISCLRSLTFQAESLIANETSTDLVEWQQAGRTSAALDHLVADAVLDSMKRNTASFDSKGVHAATKKSSN